MGGKLPFKRTIVVVFQLKNSLSVCLSHHISFPFNGFFFCFLFKIFLFCFYSIYYFSPSYFFCLFNSLYPLPAKRVELENFTMRKNCHPPIHCDKDLWLSLSLSACLLQTLTSIISGLVENNGQQLLGNRP